jgi:DNA-binding CsgD family transcriptional regulator
MKKPPWSHEEMACLKQSIHEGKSASEIADLLARSVFAVRAQRLRLQGPCMKTWKTWTQKEKDQIEEMRMDGKTAAEIAETLGRTIASVRLQIAATKVPRASRRWQEWLEAFSDGAPEAVVAERMGVGIFAVKRRKQRLRAGGHDIISVRRNQYGIWRQDAPKHQEKGLAQ